ncbi:hypothetical protein GCM10022198_06880 [Klugiella xanthotipulae]|uniref:TetR family transcriptional regulator n=1 Tax=Klugiella xanthotipulae TaxID=244735 RepID=A0A543HT61_9MICO|nr:TetR family transcriptional regulator [Klugiella xanthotipulae]TQM61547.1 TetR family transcriptional regulator [Klugiella xanthotipulae]
METVSSARKAGRPREAVLNRERIIDAAFAVLEVAGPDGFTMKGLAERLSVKPPALYNYFRNKNDVIKAMRGRLASRIDLASFEAAPWCEAVVPWARSYRSVFARHPESIALLATMPVSGQEDSVLNYEVISRSLQEGGWPLEEIVPVIVALESFIIGSALDAIAPDNIMDPADYSPQVPLFAAAGLAQAAVVTAGGVRPADLAFELGLGALVAGLRARLVS